MEDPTHSPCVHLFLWTQSFTELKCTIFLKVWTGITCCELCFGISLCRTISILIIYFVDEIPFWFWIPTHSLSCRPGRSMQQITVIWLALLELYCIASLLQYRHTWIDWLDCWKCNWLDLNICLVITHLIIWSSDCTWMKWIASVWSVKCRFLCWNIALKVCTPGTNIGSSGFDFGVLRLLKILFSFIISCLRSTCGKGTRCFRELGLWKQ